MMSLGARRLAAFLTSSNTYAQVNSGHLTAPQLKGNVKPDVRSPL